MKKTSKQLFNLAFVVFCFFLGVAGIIAAKQFFNSYSLIETILTILPLVYLTSKYYTNTTIIRYQDSGYVPQKERKFFDDIIVSMNVYIIHPLCLDFLYASCLLIVVKWINPNSLKALANGVYWICQFNKQYISHPLLILFIVLGLLTLLNILSHTVLKKARTIKKTVSFPIKLAAVLMLFISIDHGINNKFISWKVNYDPLTKKAGEVSFDATAPQQEQMKEVISAYVDYMLAVLAADQQDSEEQYSAYDAHAFFSALNMLAKEVVEMPGIRKDLYRGYAGMKGPLSPDEVQIAESFINHYQFEEAKRSVFRGTKLYEKGFEQTEQKVPDLLTILLDERKSIRKAPENPNRKVLADLLSDFLGQTFFFKSLPDQIATYSFAKDKAFDLLKTKLADGLSFIFERMGSRFFGKKDVRIAADYVKFQCRDEYGMAILHIRKSVPLFIDFSTRYGAAIKLMEQVKAEPFSAEKFRKLGELFPGDINAEYNTKMAGLLAAMPTNDRAAWEKVDMEYFRNTFPTFLNIEEKEIWERTMKIVERLHDFSIVSDSDNPGSWEELLVKYPYDPLRSQIEGNIAFLKEKKALEAAIEARKKEPLEDFLVRYPDSRWRADVQEYLYKTDFERLRFNPGAVVETPIIRPGIRTVIRPPEPEPGLMKRLLRILSKVR